MIKVGNTIEVIEGDLKGKQGKVVNVVLGEELEVILNGTDEPVTLYDYEVALVL